VGRRDLWPVRVRMVERQRSGERESLLRFAKERVEIIRRESGGEEEERTKELFVPARDLLGAALWFRSQSLLDGDVYGMAVVPGWAAYWVTVRVVGRERIWLGVERDREVGVIRVELGVQRIERDDSLTRFPRLRSATIWVTDDAFRVPARIEARIFVGRVYAELREAVRIPSGRGGE